jgi:molybdopterin-containing oxidoreductase family iron-sulfur binding subunit
MERRDFLKVVGTAAGAGALAACGNTGGVPPERMLPYVIPEPEIVPGISTYYRTTCRECPAGCGMDVRTREGRALKAEGNPLSPISHGKLCARGQASLHGLYNPDRVPQALVRQGGAPNADPWKKLTWDHAEQALADMLVRSRGRAVFLTQNYTGTLDRLVTDWCAALGVERVIYDTFAWEPVRAANRLLFGVDGVPVHDFAQAEVVLNFGADFLETWISPVDYAHGFVQGNAYRAGKRGKLYALSAHQTLTDLNAEEWVPVKPGTEPLVALAIARLVAERAGGAGAGAAGPLLAGVNVDAAAAAAGISPEKIRQIAQDFGNGGRSLAVGPGPAAQHRNATAVAAAVAILNSVAGNYGHTLSFARLEEHAGRSASYAQMQQLLGRLRSGQVQVLLLDGPNPLYAFPGQDDVAGALAKVPFIASFSSYLDETSERAHLLLPDHHFLESWSDYVPRTGVRSIVQPVMMPVFDTKLKGDVLLSVATRAKAALPNAAPTFYDYLRGTWQREVQPAAGGAGAFEAWWEESLKAGVVLTADAETRGAAAAPALSAAGLARIRFEAAAFDAAPGGPGEALVLLTYPSYRFYDGRMADRAWLQELPDPVHKVTWDSVLEISPVTAKRLGLDDGNVVEVTTSHGKATLPVWRHPGMRPDVVALQMGLGHRGFGRYADGRGVNVASLLGAVAEPESGAMVWQQLTARVKPTGEWARMSMQNQVKTESGREITRDISLAEARRLEAGGAVVAGAVAGSPAKESAGERYPEHVDVTGNPKGKVVGELQAAGGFAPETVAAGPADYPPPHTYYGEYSESQPRWAMAIDMERCIGCSACTTACYAENNIGIVGPEQVARGRLLQWIRIERYFEGPEAETAPTHVNFLPMLCQQCGNAPCEPVCPVYAAYHTPDGLNAQIYNRCVGTRYCANNCSYKVRVFNWFTWQWPEPLNWQLNPDVGVREKGVMEKCTFCVQRIRDAQNQARLQGRGVHDGEIVPACAQTCPGEAIVFGNVKDPNSRVAQVAASGRGYRVLEELNTQPAITYLKRVVDASEA